jgi:ribosomal protein S6--L-glutamate ligase
MKIALLSRDPNLYSTQRLVESGKKRGHSVHVIDYLRCYMDITASAPQVLYQGESLNDYDAIIPRIGASNTFYGTTVVRQFEMSGAYSVIDSRSILRSRDKLRCLQILTKAGVDIPITGFAHSTKDIDKVIDLVGGTPLIVKLIEGTQGSGVILAETRASARSVIEGFRELDANILVQEFIEESRGMDLRCIVVGRKVVAAMLRQAINGEFRSNLHQGALATSVNITTAERQAALKAARAMGLKIAGVDILRSKRGPLVMEVNSSPGLEGIEAVSRRDIAELIITYTEQQVRNRKNQLKLEQTPLGSVDDYE